MRSLFQDFAYCTRLQLRSPGISLIAILVAALGIGLTTTIFTVINGVVLRGLPYEEGDRLMHIGNDNREEGWNRFWLSARYLERLRERETGFESLAGHSQFNSLVISGDGPPERYSLNRVTANFHKVLGVEPMLGPGFEKGDDHYGAPGKVMISHRIWKVRYGGDPEIIGRAIRANGEMKEIVGVMPPGFRFPNNEESWLPAPLNWEASFNDEDVEGWTWIRIFGRLKAGVSADSATTAVRGHVRQLVEEDSVLWANQDDRPDFTLYTVTPFADEYLRPEAKRSAYAMFGAALLVLLIVCGNVANLLLARYVGRSREFAIRSALGAGRLGLIRLIFTEAFLVSFAGSILGIGVMLIGVRYLRARLLELDNFSRFAATAATKLPDWVDFGFDLRVTAFTAGVVVFSVLVSGVFPAWRAYRTDVVGELNNESRAASSRRFGRLSRSLVSGQIALTSALLVGMGLTMRTLYRLHRIEYNLDTRNILTMRISLDSKTYERANSAAVLAFQRLLDAWESHPEVISAATSRRMPMSDEYSTRYALEGLEYPAGGDFPRARYNTVSSHYLETLGVSLLAGRWFDRTDTPDKEPVTVVNSLLAEKAWPGQDPVGRRIGVHWGSPDWREWAVWHTVVGVVPNLKMEGLGAQSDPAPGMYFPLSQLGLNPRNPWNLHRNFALIKTRKDPMALLPSVREELSKIDPYAPVYWPKSYEDFLDDQLALFSLSGTLFKVFGLCGLFLAAVGLYGVMAYSVAQRTREVGIRASLGANRRAIFSLITGGGARQIAAGLILGILLAVLVARSLNAVLYEVSPYDLPTYLLVAILLSAVSLLACYFPARRAAKLEPVDALRAE